MYQRSDRILPNEDPDVSSVIEEIFEAVQDSFEEYDLRVTQRPPFPIRCGHFCGLKCGVSVSSTSSVDDASEGSVGDSFITSCYRVHAQEPQHQSRKRNLIPSE